MRLILLPKKARKICRELRLKGKDSYWIEATEAEASLILGQVDAVETYESAFNREDAQPSSIASTRKQTLRLLLCLRTNLFARKWKLPFRC